MTRAEALRLARKAARARRLVFTSHALDEMDIEGETRESVAAVLRRAKSCGPQDNGRWRVRSDDLIVIVHIEGSTVIVWTVFAG